MPAHALASAVMQRWKLTIEYNGTGYFGWQRQASGTRSVQGTIEQAIKALTQKDATLHVAGRTDAGVHAHGQVAHFDVEGAREAMGEHQMMRALNAHLLDESIAILKAEKVSEEFHARFGATNKHYRYRVLQRSAKPVHGADAFWHRHKKLDVAAMEKAVTYLLGTHDFTSFRASECQAKSPIRTLDRLDITSTPYDLWGGFELVFDLEAKSFLHHQVRNMIGSLVLVGEGKWTPERIRDALEAKDRKEAGQTAPASGLSLMRVDYGERQNV